MNVQYTATTRAKLNQLEISNGQIIALTDESAYYYDMSNERHVISGLRVVDGLPNAGEVGCLYLNTHSTPYRLYIWNSTDSEFVDVGGQYSAGTGLKLSSNSFKADLLSETALTNNAAAATEVSGRVYPIAIDHSGHLAVVVPWENTTYVTVSKTAAGLCPQLPSDSGTSKFLRQDGSWVAPSTVTKNTAGLCPQLPNETTTTKYLRQDGSWIVPPNTTYAATSKTAAGLCPQLPDETTTTKYLRQDGSWVKPPNTTYASQTAASGGTAVSLVTTGEKYTWNNKANSNHTHAVSIAAGSSSSITLQASTKYTLTAGGSTFGFTTPAGGSSGVTGVKGNAESSYRTGNVNLTAANVGAWASPIIVSGTLASGSTVLELSNSGITTSSTVLAVCADDATLTYSNATITTGKLTLEFSAQSAAKSIKAYIV